MCFAEFDKITRISKFIILVGDLNNHSHKQIKPPPQKNNK